MENCKNRPKWVRWSRRIGLILVPVVLAAAVWGVIRLQPEKKVVPFSQWQSWPHPFSPVKERPQSVMTNICHRGGIENLFMDRVRKTMILADEVATDMVCEFHSQAEGGEGYDILTPAENARHRLAELRRELEKSPYPQRCERVASATMKTLKEAERFYRVSACCKQGFSLKALSHAQRAYARQKAACAGVIFEPGLSPSLIRGIFTNDCEALSRAANDWSRAAEPKKGTLKFIEELPANPKDMTTEQKFRQAHQTNPLLNGLWTVLNGKGYSPFLASSFLVWRANMQSGYFGRSDGSEIPNRQYNEIRFKALDRVTAYLRKHPHDLHAQAQKEVLLGQPNVYRNGVPGNPGFFHFHVRVDDKIP